MGVKFEEKNRARELRRQGCSYNEILTHVSVSKGTLSLWLRDITLTVDQIAHFEGKRLASREKFVRVMRERRDSRWAEYRREAVKQWPTLSRDVQFMFGLALYVGEGGKTSGNRLCFTNCDPRVIKKGLEFFLKIGVPESVLRCSLHVHPGLSKSEAEKFWQNVTGLPKQQFYVTRDAVSRASKGTKGNIQVYGTCQLYAHSTGICQKVHQWMELALQAPLV